MAGQPGTPQPPGNPIEAPDRERRPPQEEPPPPIPVPPIPPPPPPLTV